MIPSAGWLEKNIPDLQGKTILITGASSGIGFEAMRALLAKHAFVYGACRDPKKAAKAKDKLLAEMPSARFDFLFYDQADPLSIHALAAKTAALPLDAIVLNAGIYFPKKGLAAPDGTSLTFQTNALGTYRAFLEFFAFHPQSRYVFVNSFFNLEPKGHDFATYQGNCRYSRTNQYGVSKRAVMSACYLARSAGADASLCHPGITGTDILREYAPWFKKLSNRFLYLFCHRPWKACLGIVSLAAGKTEGYYVPRGIFHISGYPQRKNFPSSQARKDAASFQRLFL